MRNKICCMLFFSCVDNPAISKTTSNDPHGQEHRQFLTTQNNKPLTSISNYCSHKNDWLVSLLPTSAGTKAAAEMLGTKVAVEALGTNRTLLAACATASCSADAAPRGSVVVLLAHCGLSRISFSPSTHGFDPSSSRVNRNSM